MARAVFKIQNAPNKTRWTLAQDVTSPESPKTIEAGDLSMQTTGQYFDHPQSPLPRYVSYDGSQYGPPSLDRKSSGAWKGEHTVNGHYDDYDYNTPLEERASYQIGLNTQVRSQDRDAVGHHMLYETAMLDSQSFAMLDMAEVDALKKELTRLNSRIEAANRKLALESKVKDAAQNLQRLYSVSRRPDTPQSPDSPRKSRSSLLGNRRSSSGVSSNGQTSTQAEAELATSVKMVDEINEIIKGLLNRRQHVEKKLLRHTAAVLAEQASRASQRKISGKELTNGNHSEEGPVKDDASSIYSPDDFDGIRDILKGGKSQKRINLLNMKDEHERQMSSVQDRLEHLNSQLRLVISEASQTRGVPIEVESDSDDHPSQHSVRIDPCFSRLEHNLRALKQEMRDTKAHYADIQAQIDTTGNAVEEQLAGMNQRVHNTLLLSADMSAMESLHEPPEATGQGYQHQLQYLGESLMTMERLLQQHSEELKGAREASGGASKAVEEAHAKASVHAQKVGEYEATLGGLWEILQSDVHSRQSSAHDREVDDENPLPSPGTPLKEDFSLQAFSARVQHLFDRAQSSKEQQDILRRQIQQQRELNGKSDAEKDAQLTELQTSYDQLAAEHGAAQESLTRSMAQHAQAENDASQSRSELMNVMNEFDSLRRTVDAHHQQREEMAGQLQTHQAHAANLQEQVQNLEAQVSGLTEHTRTLNADSEAKAKEAETQHNETKERLTAATSAQQEAEQRHAAVQQDMQGLESEVVRLTMELTMAKAELEGAYGSRAERAKEAQAAEVAGLNERNAQMVGELEALRGDHETLRSTHETLQNSHETLRQDHETALAHIEGLKTQASNADRTKELEREMQDMAIDFQELAKESVELEKERAQLEDLIDRLRDRCDALEAQLSDEKVRWLGIKSPTGVNETLANGREMTSTMVLRQEFKKMMRESRAEGLKLLRAEQEQRRQLEAELRRFRQANGPLMARMPGSNSAASPPA